MKRLARSFIENHRRHRIDFAHIPIAAPRINPRTTLRVNPRVNPRFDLAHYVIALRRFARGRRDYHVYRQAFFDCGHELAKRSIHGRRLTKHRQDQYKPYVCSWSARFVDLGLDPSNGSFTADRQQDGANKKIQGCSTREHVYDCSHALLLYSENTRLPSGSG